VVNAGPAITRPMNCATFLNHSSHQPGIRIRPGPGVP
jgi:hypothetical protein